MRQNITTFKALYGATGSTFPDNTTGQISEGDMRTFGETIADSALAPIDRKTVSTGSGTITLDFESFVWRLFIGSASFATPKTIALDNSSNAVVFTALLNITNVAAVLTFPSTFKMSDARWDSTGKTFQPLDTGIYKITAEYDGTNWFADVSNSTYI